MTIKSRYWMNYTKKVNYIMRIRGVGYVMTNGLNIVVPIV